MCTLTYVLVKNNNRIITSNRDESPGRASALPPQIFNIYNKSVAFPKDPVGGGTWIAVSEEGTVACLLNGAFSPHVPNPPYRLSRGLILLEVFKFETASEFSSTIDLTGIEPFTLVIFEKNLITELKWNGLKKFINHHDFKSSHIWSSEQLYSATEIKNREKLFNILKNQQPEKNKILEFHKETGEKTPGSALIINKENIVSTLSITMVEINDNQINLFYEDLFKKENHFLKITGN